VAAELSQDVRRQQLLRVQITSTALQRLTRYLAQMLIIWMPVRRCRGSSPTGYIAFWWVL